MTKINFDLTERKPGLGSIPGPRRHKYYPHLEEAIQAAKKAIDREGVVYVVYYSSRRHVTCRYRIAVSWKAHWRGEHAVWIAGGAIPGNKS